MKNVKGPFMFLYFLLVCGVSIAWQYYHWKQSGKIEFNELEMGITLIIAGSVALNFFSIKEAIAKAEKEKKIFKMKTKSIYLLNGGLLLLITFVWQGYESITLNELQPNPFDTVIAIVLAFSLTGNVYLKKRRKFLSSQEVANDSLVYIEKYKKSL